MFLGVDLASAYQRDQSGDASGRTVFDKVTATFDIAGGVLSNEDFVLDGPRIKATGKGTVGIGAQVLDYRLIPVAFARNDAERSLKVPLRVTGSWDAPKLKLDAETAVKERVEEKIETRKEELKESAREKLREKLLERLGNQ